MPSSRRRRAPADRVHKHSRRAYEQIRDLIIRGRIAPGTRLVEAELADRFAISRTPVREAIRRLVQEGFASPLRESARMQVVVDSLTEGDLQDLYAIMGALEGAVGRRVSGLEKRDRLQLAADLARANAAFETMGKQSSPDFDRLFEAHNDFHEIFVARCGTPRLRGLIDQVRPQIHRYEFIYAPLVGPNYEESFAEHRAIIRAFRAGQPASVENAIRANWSNSATRLAGAVRRMTPLGDWRAVATA